MRINCTIVTLKMLGKNGTITDCKSTTQTLIEGYGYAHFCVYSLLALNKTDSWKTKKRNHFSESKFF